MDSFKELMIDICKIQSANARAHVKHVDFQNSLQENPIYPEDRHDSDEKILFQSEISKFFSLIISDKYTEIL